MISVTDESQHIKEEIRSRLDIVEVVGRYVSLKASGQNYKGLCPFHKEKSPSFMVNPGKGIFHCFGCGKGGDVFGFLMEIEGVGFGEIIRMAAEETGVKLQSAPTKNSQNKDASGSLSKTELLSIHKLATRFFYNMMRKSSEAIAYFKKRGISGETARDFQLGYAPQGWRNLLSFMAGQSIAGQSLVSCGLAIEKNEGAQPYDRFRGRIMFPIFDIAGRPIAFGGRALTDEDHPKYLNSPETALYNKSRTLYGMHTARQAVKQSGTLLVVEGYMDVLSLYQAGIRNSVATSGTALTEQHGQMMRRFAQRIVLVFDGDSAGRRAAIRAVHILSPLNLDVRVLLLPSEHDPDTYVQQKGAEEFLKQADNAVSGFVFVLEDLLSTHGVSTPQSKSKIVQEIKPLIESTGDSIVKAEYIKTVAERLGVSEQLVYKVARQESIRRNVTDQPSALQQPLVNVGRYLSTIEGHFIMLLVNNPSLVEAAMERISPETLTDSFSRELYSSILTAYNSDSTLASVIDRTSDENARQVLSHITMKQDGYLENAEIELQHTLKKLQKKYLKGCMRCITAKLKIESDLHRKQQLLEHQKKISLDLKELETGW
ncbi:MAG: DNA primase [Fibrobacterota bacterium]